MTKFVFAFLSLLACNTAPSFASPSGCKAMLASMMADGEFELRLHHLNTTAPQAYADLKLFVQLHKRVELERAIDNAFALETGTAWDDQLEVIRGLFETAPDPSAAAERLIRFLKFPQK